MIYASRAYRNKFRKSTKKRKRFKYANTPSMALLFTKSPQIKYSAKRKKYRFGIRIAWCNCIFFYSMEIMIIEPFNTLRCWFSKYWTRLIPRKARMQLLAQTLIFLICSFQICLILEEFGFLFCKSLRKVQDCMHYCLKFTLTLASPH